MANEIQPLGLRNLLQELRLIPELFDLAKSWRTLCPSGGARPSSARPSGAPSSDTPDTSRQVLLLPGFGASDWMLEPLRRHLIAQGHRSYRWGLGTNNGKYGALYSGISTRIQQLVEKRGEPLHVVGWSFGGYLAREVAREHPEWFHQIVTLGSPVHGGAKHTIFSEFYRRMGVDLDAAAKRIEARYEIPLQVPITAVYTKADGIVCWQACIDERSPKVTHVEVVGSHIGLVYRPEVMRLVNSCIRDFRVTEG